MRPAAETGPAHLHSPPCRLPPRQKDRGVARTREPRPPPAYLLAAGGTRGCHTLPSTPCTSRHSPVSLLPSLSPSTPSLSRDRTELVAAARRSHAYRPPHASPTSQEAPPRLPLHPHPDGRHRKPLDAASSAVPLLGHRGPPPSICRRRRLPELAVCSNRPPVSSSTVSPSSPLHLIAVAVVPFMAETRRRLSSTSALLR